MRVRNVHRCGFSTRQIKKNLFLMTALLLTNVVACNDSYTKKDKYSVGSDRPITFTEMPLTCSPKTDSIPKLISGRAPYFPVQRLMKEEEGYSKISFDISASGITGNVKNEDSTHPAFYGHTKEAVTKWKFTPAMNNGVAVDVNCTFTQNYKIRGQSFKKMRNEYKKNKEQAQE